MGNNSMSWTIIKKPDYVNPFKCFKKEQQPLFFKSRRRRESKSKSLQKTVFNNLYLTNTLISIIFKTVL
jgi:hypothetical protein